ncbi:MAG: PQQ-dependent sugar dehydrogenase [Ferruginibacter sp.]
MITSNSVKRNLVVCSFLLATLLFLLSIGFTTMAQTPTLIYGSILTNLSDPVDVVNAGDNSNRLFIVQRAGQVKIVTLPGGTLLPGNFLDIPDSTDNAGEGGILSIAFHPNYENNRYFFVYYTTTDGDLRLTRFQTQAGNPNAADETTGAVLLTIPHPGQSNHNGGKLNFGPDGNLYLGIGDGGGSGDASNNAQNGNKLLGKMLRINVDDFLNPPYYTIPPDNPYASSLTVAHEIYNIGMRNPWRWSFDRLNGDVWIADVGQDLWEEINHTSFASSAALNYGWRCYEGNQTYNTTGCQAIGNYFFPIYVYDHSAAGGHSITGGYVYRATEFPAMYGYYICSDYVIARAWLVKENSPGVYTVTTQTSGIPNNITGYGEAENGDLYAVRLGSSNGTLYKITTNTIYVPLKLLQFTGKAFTGYNDLKWKTTNEQNMSHYEIEFSSDGIKYNNAGRINAINSTVENNYSFQHPMNFFTKLFYRLKSVDKDGSYTYSNVITLDGKDRTGVKVYPTLITGNNLNIISAKPVEQLTFFSAEGKNIFQTKLNNLSGSISISIPHIPKGFYIVQVKLKDEYVYEKVLIQQD